MIDALIHLGIYFVEVIITVIAILILVAGIASIVCKAKIKDKPRIKVKKMNQYYHQLANAIRSVILDKKEFKKQKKLNKKIRKQVFQKRIFVLNFKGDLRASAVSNLREEITAIINIATPSDEIVLCLESTGGVIHGYGLAASELQRFKDRQIPLTVCVDKVAASGGYMMACVADQILAAPFAIIGSIGVIAQLPNFHRLLKKHDVEFEQISAGEFKRTLTLFGENTRDARKKFQADVDEAHRLFKDFIKVHRPHVDIEKVSTGEYWFAQKAKEFNLVDKIITSDDYLLSAAQTTSLFEISFQKKKKLHEKLGIFAHKTAHKIISELKQSNVDENYL